MSDTTKEDGDEPLEGVLVHGVNVGEVSNGEEQNGGVLGDGTVAHTTLFNLLLRLLSNLGEAKKDSVILTVKKFLHQHYSCSWKERFGFHEECQRFWITEKVTLMSDWFYHALLLIVFCVIN